MKFFCSGLRNEVWRVSDFLHLYEMECEMVYEMQTLNFASQNFTIFHTVSYCFILFHIPFHRMSSLIYVKRNLHFIKPFHTPFHTGARSWKFFKIYFISWTQKLHFIPFHTVSYYFIHHSVHHFIERPVEIPVAISLAHPSLNHGRGPV